MKKFMKKTEGFTLVELIVVIAILGILAGVGTVGYSGYIKKANEAADKQLLATLNQAFITACMENGVNPTSDVTSATVVWTEDNTVTGLETVVVKNDVQTMAMRAALGVKAQKIVDSFANYYKGNESSVYKVYDRLDYDPATGSFEGVDMDEGVSVSFAGVDITLSGQDIKNFRDSAFADIGADSLLTMVDAASSLIDMNSTSSKLTELAKSEAAEAFLFKNLGISNAEEIYGVLETMYPEDSVDVDDYDAFLDEKYNQVWANNAVLYAAQNSQAVSEGIWDVLNAASVKETIKSNTNTGEQLAQSAMAFAMYSAYTKTESLAGIQLTDVYNTLDSAEFKEYLKKDEAKDDLSGYLSAMKMVNDGVASGTTAATEVLYNGFGSEELAALMNQVLGK